MEECAAQVSDGKWYIALIQNVCMARPYAALAADILPTSNKNAFFHARKEFFVRLNTAKGENTE